MKATFRTDSVLLIQSLKESESETGLDVRDRLVASGLIQSDRAHLFRIFDDSDFKGSLAWSLNAIKEGKLKYPCIQVDCHGSDEGLHLRSGDKVSWTRVQDFMNQILSATENNLFVVLGACYGSLLFRKEYLRYVPCSVLIASSEKIYGDSLSDRLVEFYTALFSSGKTSMAMARINDPKFQCHGEFSIFLPSQNAEAQLGSTDNSGGNLGVRPLSVDF
jgi:hypothetical protein